ncbi:mitochondrial peripheral inner membrane protein [Talaromyces marneffei ATCC 18224]
MLVSTRCPYWRTCKLPQRIPRPSPSPVAYRNYSAAAWPTPKRRVWIRLTAVTLTAAAIGAYIRSRQDILDANLNPLTFARYKLVSREQVSSTNSIFTLEPAASADNHETYEIAWQAGVWSVMFKQPQLQIGRDYTPLPPVDDASEDAKESLRFLIRRDPHGEVSRYLHGLQQGASIEMRGGTGIAPALQAAYIIFRRPVEGRTPKIHILWANRKREDCAGGISDTPNIIRPNATWWWPFHKDTTSPTDTLGSSAAQAKQNAIVRELQALKTRYPRQISVDYFVDEEHTFISTKEIKAYIDSIQSSPGTKKMIIISGPEGFINYMAGPKVWAHGYELQGPVKGLIQQIGVRDWEIWKL